MKYSGKCMTVAVASLLVACGGSVDGSGNSSMRPAPMAATPVIPTFNGNRTNYTITRTAAGFTVTDNVGSGGTATVNGVGSIRFADMSVNLLIGDKANTLSATDLKSLMDLYVAFFNRVPDADGLSYWIDQFKAGMTLDQIAQSFYSAALQYSAQTGYSSSMTNDDFVKLIYKNVLGRSGATAPPDVDVQYWASELSKGRSKGSMISVMLNAARSFASDPTWGWVTTLLDNKAAVATYFATEQGLNYNTPEESITKTMGIVAAITSSSIAAAKALIAVSDINFNLTLPASGSGSGSYSDCYNSALYTTGNNYQIDLNNETNGTTVLTSSSKYKVNGVVTFKDNSATELVVDTTVLTGPGAGTTNTTKNYSRLTSTVFYTYGQAITTNIPGFGSYDLITYYVPPIQNPLTLELNKPYTQTFTVKMESSSTIVPANFPDVVETTSQTFLGVESVTVPAGTFSACKLKTDTTVAGVTTSYYTWLVASGRYQGMFIKLDNGKGDITEASKLLLNGS